MCPQLFQNSLSKEEWKAIFFKSMSFQIFIYFNIYIYIYIVFALICISFFLTQLNSNPIEFELNPMYLNSIQVAKCGKNGPN